MDRNVDPQWYRTAFPLEILDMPWMERIVEETKVVVEMLELEGGETVLDLACGCGHHAMELALKGHHVVGVDLSEPLIRYAQGEAERRGLAVEFVCADIRDLRLDERFDVVLSLFDGAIGYFETDEENLKTFAAISRALKQGGKHLMQIPNADYARKNFPMRTWYRGSKMVELLEYDWDEDARLIYASTQPARYGEVFRDAPVRARQRVYDLPELHAVLTHEGMRVLRVHSVLSKDAPLDDACEYLSVVSIRE